MNRYLYNYSAVLRTIQVPTPNPFAVGKIWYSIMQEIPPAKIVSDLREGEWLLKDDEKSHGFILNQQDIISLYSPQPLDIFKPNRHPFGAKVRYTPEKIKESSQPTLAKKLRGIIVGSKNGKFFVYWKWKATDAHTSYFLESKEGLIYE